MSNINQLIERDTETIDRLLDVWESAVRETHSFLSENDIVALRPEVEQGLRGIPNLYCFTSDNGVAQGFIGVADTKIEMLFVAASARGKGIGKQLLQYAINNLGATLVDVNEQNTQGVGFYEHMGFQVISRSAFDDQGRPFPILHLEMKLQEV